EGRAGVPVGARRLFSRRDGNVGRSVLVVDDEPAIVDVVGAFLRREGFTVRTAATGRQALDAVATQVPDIVVLDLLLPDMPGEEVCARLRRVSTVPILMLTAKAGEDDRVRGLALGADDYVVKPFSLRELAARIRAVLRRSPDGGPPADVLVLRDGRMEVDLARHEASVDGTVVGLTAMEFRLLAALCAQPSRVFTRARLMEAIRARRPDGVERTIDQHVKNLRRKLNDASWGAGGVVGTVFGVGYRLSDRWRRDTTVRLPPTRR
ncbi:MAG: response regulator transcription factor, partial [Actinomycetota bacterium]